MKRTSLLVIVFLASALGAAQGQSLSFEQPNLYDDAGHSSHGKAEFRFALFPFPAAAKPRARPLGLRLMPSGSVSMASPFPLTPTAAGPNLPVLGGGTLGRLTKWTGFTSSNSFIGDSTIFESKEGLVGIGTDAPTSRLTVAGTIRSLSGGIQFPDGTIQTTSAAGALVNVIHDATLMGNGTAGSPLGVAVPLILRGSSNVGVIWAINDGETGRGVYAIGAPGSDGVEGVGGLNDVGQGGPGVRGQGGSSNTQGGSGVVGRGGFSGGGTPGIGAQGFGGTSNTGTGGDGVRGIGGISINGAGGDGVFGIKGDGPSGDGLAGKFFGDVEITGVLDVTSGTKNFKIDHPLDPENKYLYHAAIESSEVLNIYSGNVLTNASGEAVVELPDWFEALNKDLRYQLTVVGTFAQAIVAQKVKKNRFVIKTSAPSVEVSWQVTGVRADRALLKRPFKVERDKPEQERGTYLNPEAYDQAEERGLEWARRPELMRQLKETREQVKRQQTAKGR